MLKNSSQISDKTSVDVITLIECLIDDLTYKDKAKRLERRKKPQDCDISAVLNAFSDCATGLFESDFDTIVESLQHIWSTVAGQKGIKAYCEVLRLLKHYIQSHEQHIDSLLKADKRLPTLLIDIEVKLVAFKEADARVSEEADVVIIEKNETFVSLSNVY